MGQDLTPDVAALSTKLIEAIDAQSSLEDRIQAMRRELESLRQTNTDLTTKLSTAVEKTVFDAEVQRRQRSETKNTQLQGEIDELTGSLFNEANKMVADAKKDTAVWAKRNNQLQQQLKEKDTLLENMQQQLTGLKAVLQDMTEEEQANEKLRAASVADDSQSQRSGNENTEDDQLTAISAETEYSLASPVRPLVRLDLQNVSEFRSIAQNINLVNSVHQTLYGHGPKKSISSENVLSPKATNNNNNNSNTNLSPATTGNSLEKTTSGESPLSTPRLHLNFTGVNSPAYQPPSLKDFKFFKRALADDIDPTLRLENSPHISWYARRSIMSSIIEGTAVVEPISGINEGYKFNGGQLTSSTNSSDGHLYAYPQGGPPVATRQPCKFCGESRNSSLLYARMHNLRIDRSKEPTTPGHSASNSASGTSALGVAINFNKANKEETPTGYALCFYCLNRVRSVCDFAQFMRSIRDGVWKVEDGDAASQYKAWDECVRLRERMFWARIGGSFAGNDRERVTATNLNSHLHKKFVQDLQTESEPRSSMDGTADDNIVEEEREAEEESTRLEAQADAQEQEGESSQNDLEFKESREFPETPDLQKSESPKFQQHEEHDDDNLTTENTTNDEQENAGNQSPTDEADVEAADKSKEDDTTGDFEDSVEYQSLPHE